jgi:hypothetical protein
MFADPQALTLDASALTLNRTGSGTSSGVFQTADGLVKMTVSHAYGKRTRHTIRIDHQKTAVDPLVPAQNKPYSMSYYLVVDVPPVGYSVADQIKIVKGLFANLAASTDANYTKLLGGES